jgi:NAD(P)-dependent dehydrogenase (short-subunit alcohol dehydrogenase family)
MTKAFLDNQPELMEKWCAQNPMGRLANPDEMRGIALFLGSDASTFCTGSKCVIYLSILFDVVCESQLIAGDLIA